MGNENQGLMRIVAINLQPAETPKGVTRPLASMLLELFKQIVHDIVKRLNVGLAV
jgi:hypothetical protein